MDNSFEWECFLKNLLGIIVQRLNSKVNFYFSFLEKLSKNVYPPSFSQQKDHISSISFDLLTTLFFS